MTIVDTIADEHYGDKVKLAMAFAELLNQEARALEKDGVDVIQFDEPAFNVYMEDVKRWGIDALHRAIQGLKCTTASTSATATASRPTSTGRNASAGNGASTSRFSRRSPGAASTRSRSSASIRTCRWSSCGFSRARTCWSASSTSPATRWRRRRRSPTSSGKALKYVPARAPLPLHQLRHGADGPRDRA